LTTLFSIHNPFKLNLRKIEKEKQQLERVRFAREFRKLESKAAKATEELINTAVEGGAEMAAKVAIKRPDASTQRG